MPSYPIHLAIAKEYLKTHNEENVEEFYQGVIAPDNKPILELGNGRLHYGENSHKPDLNRYYHEKGLDSSYNRGYFLHLLTDYLFYNRFLNEYSHDIYDDYIKMNKRIIEKYDLQIPEIISKKVKLVDGDLKVIDENEIYKFIDTIGRFRFRGI